jgi:hypothetical protein
LIEWEIRYLWGYSLHCRAEQPLRLSLCRTNFLTQGTIARGAAETGAVEYYINSRLQRNPVVKPYVAAFAGQFIAGARLLLRTASLLHDADRAAIDPQCGICSVLLPVKQRACVFLVGF